MAAYESVEAVHALTQETISKLNASQLRKALTTALNAKRVEVPVNIRPWDVILGRAPPPLGIFVDSDFLKGYSMLNSLQVVCTLAMAALRKSGNPKFEKMLKSVIRLMTAISS